MVCAKFAYIWQYRIDPACRAEFLAAYAPAGEWARLFARDPAYIETKLLRADGDEDTYITIDFWTSKADRDAFRARHGAEFDALDRRCEAWTRQEVSLGDWFDLPGTD